MARRRIEPTQSAAPYLPWEWSSDRDQPRVGICLSGGGLRAASFALGVLQELQVTRGMLFGPSSADMLAAVSGGSYIAATFALNARAAPVIDPEGPPLAGSSPEARFVANHAEYLIEHGKVFAGARLLFRLLLNVLALALLFVWLGLMLADLDWIIHLVANGQNWTFLLPPHDVGLQWVLAFVALSSGGIILRGLSKDGGVRRSIIPLAGLAGLLLTGSSLVSRMETTPALSDPGWWRDLRLWGVWVLIATVCVTISMVLTVWPPKGRADKALSSLVAFIAVSVPRGIGLVVLSVSTVKLVHALAPALAEHPSDAAMNEAVLWFVGSLIGGLIASGIPNRISLHELYRTLLSRCFAVRRSSIGPDRIELDLDAALADLAPPSEPDRRFPRLLVCATANVRFHHHGNWRSYAPFVFSHDRSGVPGIEGASFSTRKLELGRIPTWRPLRRVRQLSLMSSVAFAGAALSPSMGKMTIPAVRPFLAALNVRTGAWLPNPLSRRVRERVERMQRPGPVFRDKGLGGGFDQIVPEMLGIQTSSGRQVYVTDGGHYDNLGLTTLLRAGCREIWCVDAQADKRGRAHQLEHVIGLAASELDIPVEIDVSRFRVTDGVLANSFAQGPIRYRNMPEGRLIVIKLGMCADAPEELRAYRGRDRSFPYHPTPIQWYSADRFEAYRELGRFNARAALRATDPSPAEQGSPGG